MIKIILIISFLYSASWATSCTDVRLDKEGGPLEGFPVKHQDGLPLCEHYSACQVINAARFYRYGREAFKNDCSPIAAAGILTARINSNGTDLNQLSSEQVLFHISKMGSCHDELVLERFGGAGTNNFCEELKFAFNLLRPNQDGTSSPRNTTGSSFYCNIKLTPGKMYDGLDLVARFLRVQSDMRTVAGELERICRDNTQPIAISKIDRVKAWEISPDQRNSEIKKGIDSSLDGIKPMPAIIKYCVHVLTDQNIVGTIDGKLDAHRCSKNGKHGLHASVVVGRRLNKRTNKCEYLVRNSEGTSCNEYDKNLECDRTKGGKPCPPGSECGGQIWVPEEKLFPNVSTVVKAE